MIERNGCLQRWEKYISILFDRILIFYSKGKETVAALTLEQVNKLLLVCQNFLETKHYIDEKDQYRPLKEIRLLFLTKKFLLLI